MHRPVQCPLRDPIGPSPCSVQPYAAPAKTSRPVDLTTGARAPSLSNICPLPRIASGGPPVLHRADSAAMVNRRRISVGEFRPESGEAAEILVVSLESAEARRAAFAARAAETSLALRFFPACTAPAPGITIDEAAIRRNQRPEARRAGNEGVSTCRDRGSPYT